MKLALRLTPEDLADHRSATNTVLAFLREAHRVGASVELSAQMPYLTPDQVAKQLGMSRPTIPRRIKVGNRNRIPVAEFERFRDAYFDELAGALAAD